MNIGLSVLFVFVAFVSATKAQDILATNCFDDSKEGSPLKEIGEECKAEPGGCYGPEKNKCIFTHGAHSITDENGSIDQNKMKERVQQFANKKFEDELVKAGDKCYEEQGNWFACFYLEMKNICPEDPFIQKEC